MSTVTIAPVPTSAIAAEQAPNFDAAFAEVQSWVGKAFPGAVVAVGVHGRLVALKAFGRISYAPDAPPMPRDAIFDLASLTKVVGTTTAAEILYDRGLLDLDRPVVAYLPSFAGTPGHERITVRHLLSHSSGLFTTDLLWQHSRNRQELLALIDRMPMAWAPGTHYQYRDENMILMGEIIERLSGQPLDRFLHDAVFAPLGMTDTGFNPPASRIDRIPPTEQDDLFRHRLVRGEVHDENAFVLGGVAGHAGLFSTARDLSRLAQVYLDHGRHDGRPFLKPGSLAAFTTRTAFPPGVSGRWDGTCPIRPAASPAPGLARRADSHRLHGYVDLYRPVARRVRHPADQPRESHPDQQADRRGPDRDPHRHPLRHRCCGDAVSRQPDALTLTVRNGA
ncbi:beta-lactamase family protein [Sphingomonas sp. WKB10]|nr:beta-lactamase family protein [Sphingomonas sp. WKB10]